MKIKRDKMTVPKVLTFLRKAFEGLNATEADELWSILTALRGPDADESEQLKDATTVPIRWEVLRTNRYVTGAIIKKDMEHRFDLRNTLQNDGSRHFWKHAERAWYALQKYGGKSCTLLPFCQRNCR